MRRLVTNICAIAVLQLLFFNSIQTESQDGINFCVPNLCHCVPDLIPIDISCDGIQLKSFWEESDWNVTLAALNLTGNEPLSVTFVGNEIEHIPVFSSINITMLLLQNNKIKSIESSAFSHLLSLELLNLAHNSLTADSLMEGIFFGQFKADSSGYFPMPLKHLNLSYNNIHSIPKDTFDHFTSLTTIDLGHNPLTTLDGNSKYAIGDLPKLNFLGLSNTSISTLPEGMLHDLMFLGSLDLSYNLFTTVPKELFHTHELTVLNLNGNLFKTLDKDSFQGLDKLVDLRICHMHTLRRIEQFAFTPLKNLTKLVLAFNPLLKEIDDGAFEDLVKEQDVDGWLITEIHLNDNGLKQLDQALLPWEHVEYIDIQNNPFRCDCNLEWMVLKLVERISESNPTLTSDLTCAEPKDMKGKSIKTFTKEPKIFERCSRNANGKYGNLIPKYDPTDGDPIRAAAVTILVIGILLVVIGLSIVGFLVKRRAITQALMAPSSQIRYERADTEDGSEWRYSQPSSIYK